MKQILVPTSGTKNATESAKYATRVAAVTNSKLHVLHVALACEDPDMLTKVVQSFQHTADKAHVIVQGASAVGKISEQIIEYAESHSIDLILMGASNGFIVEKWISNEVLGNTAIPVLVMPYQTFQG